MTSPRPPAPTDLQHLRRYAPLVGDVDAFVAASLRPLRPVVWANSARCQGERVEALIRAHVAGSSEIEPLGWCEHAWRLPLDARPGKWPAFLMGLLHVQEETSMWAVALLDPQPGERVLDLCAAPGGKTARIALAMQDRGLIVANDLKLGRLAGLRRTLDRLGVTCAVVTRADGVGINEPVGFYDRVLVDAPCSCEGTSRKAGGRKRAAGAGHREFITQIQRALLRRAVHLTRPGGVIVYSTCTYAPEENEAVLDALEADAVVVEPVVAPAALNVRLGVPSWNGRSFRADVVNMARVWPHLCDAGGFSVACLRRV